MPENLTGVYAYDRAISDYVDSLPTDVIEEFGIEAIDAWRNPVMPEQVVQITAGLDALKSAFHLDDELQETNGWMRFPRGDGKSSLQVSENRVYVDPDMDIVETPVTEDEFTRIEDYLLIHNGRLLLDRSEWDQENGNSLMQSVQRDTTFAEAKKLMNAIGDAIANNF